MAKVNNIGRNKVKIMLNKIAIATGLMAVIIISQASIARADDVTDAIKDANILIRQMNEYDRTELQPAIAQQEQYLERLKSSCLQENNQQACNQFTEFYRRQSERYDRQIQQQRQRMGY